MKRSNLQKMARIDREITDLEQKISVVQDLKTNVTVCIYFNFNPSPIASNIIRLLIASELEDKKFNLLKELEELNAQ